MARNNFFEIYLTFLIAVYWSVILHPPASSNWAGTVVLWDHGTSGVL